MADNATTMSVAEHSFELPDLYAEGHTITAVEANALNQLRRENIRNNLRARVKSAKESDTSDADINKMIEDYASSYEFNMASGRSSRPVDPVERKALSIARTLVVAKLKEQGRQVKGLNDEQKEAFNAKIAEVAQMEQVVAEAKKQVNAEKKANDALASVEI